MFQRNIKHPFLFIFDLSSENGLLHSISNHFFGGRGVETGFLSVDLEPVLELTL